MSEEEDYPVPFRVQVLSWLAHVGFQLFTPDMNAVRRSYVMKKLWDFVPPSPTFVDGVATKDIVIEEKCVDEVSARMFLPMSAAVASQRCGVILYFHGGGFCFGSPQQRVYDSFCRSLSKFTSTLVLSVDYRLSPKHKHPAAYQDAMKGFQWLMEEGENEPWIQLYADVSRCFLAGDSAGGNIVHNLSLAILQNQEIQEYKNRVMGQILFCPFFAGSEKLPSEILFSKGYIANENNCRLMWKYFLPDGSDLNHVACDPILHSRPEYTQFPRTLVILAGMDYLRDRGMAYAQCLEKANGRVVCKNYPGMVHVFMLFDIQLEQVMKDVVGFMRYNQSVGMI